MEWEGREESENVEDRRSYGGRVGLAVGGGAGILLVILGLIFGFDPNPLAQLIGQGQPQGAQQGAPQGAPVNPEEERLAHFAKVIFHDTEVVWDEQFRQMGQEYQKPVLVLFSRQVESACGLAESAVGPFYCPGDS